MRNSMLSIMYRKLQAGGHLAETVLRSRRNSGMSSGKRCSGSVEGRTGASESAGQKSAKGVISALAGMELPVLGLGRQKVALAEFDAAGLNCVVPGRPAEPGPANSGRPAEGEMVLVAPGFIRVRALGGIRQQILRRCPLRAWVPCWCRRTDAHDARGEHRKSHVRALGTLHRVGGGTLHRVGEGRMADVWGHRCFLKIPRDMAAKA